MCLCLSDTHYTTIRHDYEALVSFVYQGSSRLLHSDTCITHTHWYVYANIITIIVIILQQGLSAVWQIRQMSLACNYLIEIIDKQLDEIMFRECHRSNEYTHQTMKGHLAMSTHQTMKGHLAMSTHTKLWRDI